MWSAVLPVKRLSRAKTRLRGAVPGVSHDALVLAIALDTIAAVAACPAIDRLLVVTAEPALAVPARRLGALVVPDPAEPGLNAALRHGATAATGPLAALTGDLPALRPAELAAALAAATAYPRAYLPDAEATGTVLLTALSPTTLDPHFGPHSAAAHAATGATRLTGPWPSLRRDVDTPTNLTTATALGLGPRTTALVTARTA
jgi:2-phospho-L-lactate/phosphoenolpyruvate guanylyltransferase